MIGIARFRSKPGFDVKFRVPHIVRFRRAQNAISRLAPLRFEQRHIAVIVRFGHVARAAVIVHADRDLIEFALCLRLDLQLGHGDGVARRCTKLHADRQLALGFLTGECMCYLVCAGCQNLTVQCAVVLFIVAVIADFKFLPVCSIEANRYLVGLARLRCNAGTDKQFCVPHVARLRCTENAIDRRSPV